MDTFAAETEANKEKTPEQIKAALQEKAQASQEVTLLSRKCFPFFLPRMNNLKEGMGGKVDFIWIGHHGILVPPTACFLDKYGWLLSNFGMLQNFFVVFLFAQMSPF